MIDFINEIVKPHLKRKAELKATKKALRYAVHHFCGLQGHKVTGRDVQEFLGNIKKMEGAR